MTTTALHRTPFHEFHLARGAKMVPFAGWEMPLLYGSIIEEHRAVRNRGGLFDVSHMGRFHIAGPEACQVLDRLCTRAIDSMKPGQVRYTLICNDQGGCRDDVLVYRRGETDFTMVCNAANREKLLAHIAERGAGVDYRLDDVTFDTAMLALQGPAVLEHIAGVAPEVSQLKRYRFLEKNVMGASLLISRTGYTGEDGVEIILPAMIASMAIGFLTRNMDDPNAPIRPAGLGARDTLRMEAAMPLYGHEITENDDPLTAGLGFAVKLDKPDAYIGQAALKKMAADGPARPLVGLTLEGRRTARAEMTVTAGGTEVGVVTSACLSPTLDVPIALALVDRAHSEPGTTLSIDLGRAMVEARVTPIPFYKRG